MTTQIEKVAAERERRIRGVHGRFLAHAGLLLLSGCIPSLGDLADRPCNDANAERDPKTLRCKCRPGTRNVDDLYCEVEEVDAGSDDAGADDASDDLDSDVSADGPGETSDAASSDAQADALTQDAQADAAPDSGAEPVPDATVDGGVPNACTDLSNGCKPAYPCTLTEPTGYTCLGQYADWKMPDSAGPLKSGYQATSDEVLDNVTKLVWQRSSPASYRGCQAGAMCTWPEAVEYCKALSLAGSDEWRLPSKIELESIVEETKGAPPAVDTVFTNTQPGAYWTSSPYAAALESSVWSVHFDTGLSAQRDTPPIVQDDSSRGYVRCVRGVRGAGRPTDRYASVVVARGREVVDTFTGLTWLIEDDRSFRTWADASAHCQSLGGGYRLPAYKELLTIVDPTRANPALDTQIFQGLVQTWFSFWSSSTIASGDQAWTLDILYGQGIPGLTSSTNRAVCVR